MDKMPLIVTKRKAPKGEDGHKTFSVRLREEIVTKLDSISNETGRTRNELVDLFRAYAIEQCEIEE